MTTFASTSLYDILVEKGVDKAVAKEALADYITREEAKVTLATKEDLWRNTRWVIAVFVGIAFGQIVTITGIMALMFNFYTKVGA